MMQYNHQTWIKNRVVTAQVNFYIYNTQMVKSSDFMNSAVIIVIHLCKAACRSLQTNYIVRVSGTLTICVLSDHLVLSSELAFCHCL